MGRPRLTDSNKRNNKLNIYLTQKELEIANNFAQEQNLPLSLVVRIALLDYIQKKNNL